MSMFDQKNDIMGDVVEMRNQGLTDDLITKELAKKGHTPAQVKEAISQADSASPPAPGAAPGGDLPSGFPGDGAAEAVPEGGNDATYARIEEITENMIDEKWDELIAEVKKIVEWKNQMEEKQGKIHSDVDKLKEDFNVLHQGVLGKLEDYDKRMRDVGTELNAVGKVFKDVVPEFVENVKELGHMTGKIREKKEK